MKKYFKKIIGVILVFVGLLALLTPFTPGSWLIFVGLELLGLRFLLWNGRKKEIKRLSERLKEFSIFKMKF